MKVTVEQVANAMPALLALAQKELPAKAAYRAAKLVRKMQAEHKDYLKARNDLVKKYGEAHTNGGGVRVTEEKREAYEGEHLALLAETLDLEGCAPIAWADVESIALAPAVLADLQPTFLEEPK